VIADTLLANNIKEILLPAYLCPSILEVLDLHAVNYTFYGINEDFSIDLDDLLIKSVNQQAVYFINYFGFQHSPEMLATLISLQSKGMILVEDNAQAGFSCSQIGDFWFNSMRKFCAYDGGYMTTRNFLPSCNLTPDHQNHRLPLIREYRRRLHSYLFEDRGTREEIDRLFYQAEHFYEQDRVILGDGEEQTKIEHLDWQAIKAVRRRNYNYLLEQINDLPNITPIFPTLQTDNMPLGLPVYISGFSRNRLIDQLADESISLTVHWDALLFDPRTKNNLDVVNIAEHILTLPVDQYTSKSQLDYLVDHLVRSLSIHSF